MTDLRTEPVKSQGAMSYPEVLAEMRSLLPIFRARVPETTKLRRLPEATCEDIRKSGLARILQPARYGGAEASLESMIDVLVPVGSACSATAWCLAQFMIHDYMIARWPKAAQDAIWIDKPDALVSGILIPLLGKAKRVDGGATLTGRWPFVSGISGADWCILSGMMESTTGGALIESYFLLPVEQVTVLDTWYGIGLKGSASHDVQVNDLFAPEHMIITVKDLLGGDFPGRITNPGALFRPPVYMTFGILLTSAVIGMAEAMLVEYLAQSRKAVTIMAAKEIGTFQAQQIKIGEATSALNAAQALVRADAREIQALAAADQQPDSATRSKYRSNAAYASQLVYQAAQRIFDLAGARAVYSNSEIGRIFLDIIVATRHVTQNVDINTAEHGRARVDLPLTNPSL
jgi:3-hydroxy-9,10-secoandrosta-1,3,5(10)-triene-9,17-dione monooxygenase